MSYGAATVHGTQANGVAAEVCGTASGTTLTASVVNVTMAEGDPGCPAGLRGKVQNLDATTKTFQLLTMTVNYAAATVNGTLAEGVMVEVQGSLASGSTTLLNATRVIVTLAGGRGGCPSDKQAMGAITALDLTALTVTVSGTTFWLDTATVIMAKDATLTADQLKVGDWVAVLADASKTDTAGDAYATSTVVIPAAPVNPVRCLMGPVTAYTSQGTTLPAASFWSTVAVGNLVQVAGTASGATFTATRINLMPAAPTLMGLVTAVDATAQTLVVSGLTLSVTADTTYASHGAPVSATTFWSTVAVGNLVEAAGATSGTTFSATRILLGGVGGGGCR